MSRDRDDVSGLVSELAELGYPALPPPPLGNLQAFDWVADCLAWLCQRSAPGLALPPRDFGSEAARVAFLTSLGAALYDSTHIRLNLRRLYRAGGSAARELHRLAAALRTATAAVAAAPPKPAGPPVPAELRRQMDVGLAAARQQAAQLEAAVAAAGQEVGVLEGRVEKRHVELDRLERRLDSLQAIKPANSGEVQALEAELSELYQQYLHKFRNLEYLEGVLDKYSAARQAEAEEADKQLRRIQRQVAAEELRLLQGSGDHGVGAAGAALGALDSDDSEAELLAGSFGGKALPKLGFGALGAGGAGPGAASAAAAAAAALDLLPEEDSGGSVPAAGGGGGRSRLSVASSAGGIGDVGAGQESRVSFGAASQIPAHYGSGKGPGGAAAGARPPSAGARRTTGSGNALLRKASSTSSGGTPDLLSLDAGARRLNMQPGSSDF